MGIWSSPFHVIYFHEIETELILNQARYFAQTVKVSYLQNFHDEHHVCKIFMISIRFAQFFLISIRFAKGHSLHHMLRGSAEGVVCANNGHLIRRYYQAAHFCQTNSRLFLHWKTFRTSSNQPSFAAEIFLGAHHDNINFVNKQDYFLK